MSSSALEGTTGVDQFWAGMKNHWWKEVSIEASLSGSKTSKVRSEYGDLYALLEIETQCFRMSFTEIRLEAQVHSSSEDSLVLIGVPFDFIIGQQNSLGFSYWISEGRTYLPYGQLKHMFDFHLGLGIYEGLIANIGAYWEILEQAADENAKGLSLEFAKDYQNWHYKIGSSLSSFQEQKIYDFFLTFGASF